MITRLTRRGLVRAGGSLTLAGGGLFTPAISRAADRPEITHGLQSGDVTAESGLVWARVSRPSRVHVAFSTTESFSNLVGGVRILSIAHYSLGIANGIHPDQHLNAGLGLGTSTILAVVVTAGGLYLATRRLQRFTLAGDPA